MIWAKSKFSKFSVFGGHRGYKDPIAVPGGINFWIIEVVQKLLSLGPFGFPKVNER